MRQRYSLEDGARWPRTPSRGRGPRGVAARVGYPHGRVDTNYQTHFKNLVVISISHEALQ